MPSSRFGAVAEVGRTHYACGQYRPRIRPDRDRPGGFYTPWRIGLKRPGRITFAGLLIGLGFLALVLLLETIMDTVFIVREILTGGILLAAAALVAFNLWLLV